jgi:NADP-dependent 3-hydroxy acid dehydrogenase YdfG
MKNVIVITGASSGFGALAAHALACRSHRLREHARNSRP